jgi:uncharacterized membrane protein
MHDTAQTGGTIQVIERNIEALLERQRREESARTLQQRIADGVTRFTGSMAFIHAHLLMVAAWTLVNVGWTPLRPFDPTFVLLATVASVEAIFLSSFVLLTQNRMQAQAERRADLSLQISLLTEHELTRLMKLVSQISTRHPAVDTDPELQELQRDVVPEEVLDVIEAKRRQLDTQP